MDAVTMDFKQPVGNTSGFGWPSCCHMSYWLAQGHIFLRSSVAFSFLGMNTALGYKRFEYHLERNGIPQAFFNTTSNHSFVSVEAFIHFLFGGVPNNRGDKCIPSENVKTMRQFVLNKITEVKNVSNVNEATPGGVLDGGQTFDPLSEITTANNLQVMNDSEQTGSGTTNEQGSQESPIVVYIQTQENRPIESAGETAPFPHIRYTDPLPSFQQVGGNDPEPEPTSDVTCEVMATGFGGGQEGNRETFLEGELRTISTLAEQELQYCIHGGQEHGNCWICNKRPKNSTDQNSDKPFRCTICDKSFPVAAHLKRHQRTHTGEKPHHCQHCGKSFALAQNLKLHLRVHTGEKPYSCTFCDKKYPGHSDLARHLRTHTGERPYSCDHCDKAFVSASSLRKHHLVHTGERPHSCPHCPRTFKRRWHLILHIRAHTGERPHVCHLCEKAYRDKTSLNKHLRAHSSGRLEERQRIKEQREAITAAKTLAQSKRKIRVKKGSSLKTKDAHFATETDDRPDAMGPTAGTNENVNEDFPSTVSTSTGSSKTVAGTRRSLEKKSDKKKSKTQRTKKTKKNINKAKTTVTSASETIGSAESAKECPAGKDGGSTELYVVQLPPGLHAMESENNESNKSSQGEKLQALADAASLHATTFFSGDSDVNKSSTTATGGSYEL